MWAPGYLLCGGISVSSGSKLKYEEFDHVAHTWRCVFRRLFTPCCCHEKDCTVNPGFLLFPLSEVLQSIWFNAVGESMKMCPPCPRCCLASVNKTYSKMPCWLCHESATCIFLFHRGQQSLGDLFAENNHVLLWNPNYSPLFIYLFIYVILLNFPISFMVTHGLRIHSEMCGLKSCYLYI